MRRGCIKVQGFTLIELLIVVAIIAILAAIAVPNFLEAQTRAKVSRVKSDLRTFTTALESYYIDNNSYTGHNLEGHNPQSVGSSESQPWWHGLGLLTSPVAYITSIGLDPFGGSKAGTRPQDWRGPGYGLATGVAGTRTAGGFTQQGRPLRATDCYMLESDGPDHWDDTGGLKVSTSRFPWPDIANIDDLTEEVHIDHTGAPLQIHAMLYDPTNGTISGGEIMRFGGVKPAGQTFEYLWSNAGK